MWRGIMRILLRDSIFARITRTLKKEARKDFCEEDAGRRVIVVSRSISRHNKIDTCRENNIESSFNHVRHSVHVSEIMRLSRNYNGMQIRVGGPASARNYPPAQFGDGYISAFSSATRIYRMITMAINEASIRNSISFLATDYVETADYYFLYMNTLIYYDII